LAALDKSLAAFSFWGTEKMTDTKGRYIPDDAPEAYTYNSDGTLATITKTHGSETWVNTFAYASGNLSTVSGWVKQ
jgi:hypothetical protein